MKRLAKIISKSQGETLVETLAAVLLCSLAAVLLMTAVSTASSINVSAKAQSHELQVQERLAAQHSGYYVDGALSADNVSGTIVFQDPLNFAYTESINVEVAGGDDIVSYDWKAGA